MIYQGVRCHVVTSEPPRRNGSACILIEVLHLHQQYIPIASFESELKTLEETTATLHAPVL